MKINNKEINTLKINNKLVESIKRLNDNKIIYRAFDGLLLTERTGKTILSTVDNDIAYFEVQLTKNDNPISLENIEVELYQDDVLIDSYLTDSNSKVVFKYSARGMGDTSFQAKVSIFTSEIYKIEDCIDTILGDTNQSNKFDSSISLRNNGTSSINYDSANKYYILNITKNSSESFIPIGSITGLDNIIIEFDGYLKDNYSFIGLCFYRENSNWGRLGTKQSVSTAYEYGGNTNGTYAEADISGSNPPANTWLHYKFTITNNTIHRQVYNGETLIYEDTRTYTGFFTSTTKYGFSGLWDATWIQYFKNITIKPLQSIDINVDNPILSFADSTLENLQTATLTATVSPVAQGKIVKIYKDDILVATEQTDSQGQVSYTYESQGVGDVEFRFECGLLIQTCEVCDALLYREGYTKSEDYVNINFPSAYEISFKTLKSANTNAIGTINMFNNNNQGIGLGYFGNSMGAEIRYYNGSSWSEQNTILTPSLNVATEWKYIYENGVGTATIGQSSKSYSQSYTATKISWGMNSQTNMKIKDLLIKPL